MTIKTLLNPRRRRKVPRQFSWVDQRLVREKYICRCGPEALALYLLLVTVADAEGLSYYSDRTVAVLLSFDDPTLRAARRELVEADLIAWGRPLYQVLSLDPVEGRGGGGPPRRGRPARIGEILKEITGERS
ncbi:MAG: hypothetical protein AAF492_02670 [Verrucomicrobiota bacterium]